MQLSRRARSTQKCCCLSETRRRDLRQRRLQLLIHRGLQSQCGAHREGPQRKLGSRHQQRRSGPPKRVGGTRILAGVSGQSRRASRRFWAARTQNALPIGITPGACVHFNSVVPRQCSERQPSSSGAVFGAQRFVAACANSTPRQHQCADQTQTEPRTFQRARHTSSELSEQIELQARVGKAFCEEREAAAE
jgi:hypothetical protein